MAHAIIFTDRGPRTRDHHFTSQYYTYSAGAYKIASVLREMGLTVLVVSNCANLSLKGIKTIIDRNSENLLWVGISVTFFVVEAPADLVHDYRQEWACVDNFYIDADRFCVKTESHLGDNQTLIWNSKQLGLIAQHLQSQHNIPLLIGGANADILIKSPFLHKNMRVITGYAESFVKTFTKSRLQDPMADFPLMISNEEYDNHDFKRSSILWAPEDYIKPDDWLPIEVARGCAFNCAYCSYPRRGQFDAYKHPSTLRDELIRNYELFGVTRYLVVDDLYNDSTEKVEQLFDMVWSRLPFQPEWVSYMRLDMLWNKPESAILIRDSGCRYASFGIETLNDIAGRRVGKGLGKKRIIETLEMLKPIWNNQTLVGANMIAGLPYEPLDSILESVEWSTETDLIHSPHWQPMYVVSSDHKTTAKIDQNPDKFGISWIDSNEWINSAGVTRQMTNDIVKGYVSKLGKNKFGFSMASYVDVRTAGFTHEEIANYKSVPLDDTKIDQFITKTKNKIYERLNYMMNLST